MHAVTNDTDRGDVLARKPLKIAPGETAEEILPRLHPLEHRVVADAVSRWSYERG
jgi:folate-dependent phosphoribosylglycinamide formyltransferase PurN